MALEARTGALAAKPATEMRQSSTVPTTAEQRRVTKFLTA
jgi:hypothetical protein